MVLLTITVLLAPSVRNFLQQRAQIGALQQNIQSKEQQQADLKKELSRWDDPAYIKAQARDRVNMVMPGETSYWVYGADGTVTTPSSGTDAPAGKVKPTDLPWVDGLLQSIKRSATR
ncbi:FtsB family cell division protein [Paenarthrobacter sp. Z7-10]|uniref:FtsB family cell division protein n=1 Tax=Paenarthrobacter sp. Z7-10 TaxID=2787635 RepID=UPI0022A92581|nr:septum formation initiator family protein [Paenarthrobacter sp. Z7-10]